MYIIHLMHKFKIGGVESAVLSAGKHTKKNIKFVIGVIDKSTCPLLLSDEPIINPYYKWNPFGYIVLIKKLISECPDVLVCSLWRSIVVGVVVKLLHRETNLILFFHNTEFKHLFDKSFSLIGLKFCDAVFVDSIAVQRKVSLYTKKDIYPISFLIRKSGGGVEFKHNANFNFIYFGRLSKQKNLNLALKLVSIIKLKTKRPPLFYIIGPDEGELNKLKGLTKELCLDDNIVFHEAMSFNKIKEISENVTFYLQLSDFEGMGMSVVESMQVGLIPVVTAVGEIGYYVDNLVNGVIFDDLETASELIIKIVENDDLYKSMSRKAFEKFINQPTYADSFFKAVGIVMKRHDK